MLTIYFDTSFFINLGQADALFAENTIDELNRYDVRYVKSPVLFMELARRHEKAENHARILDLLGRLELPPLDLDDRDWSDLRPGAYREELGQFMREMDESDVYFRAVCSAANQSFELSCLS